MQEEPSLASRVEAWAFEAERRDTITIGELGLLVGERGIVALLAALAAACAVAGAVPLFSTAIGIPMLFLGLWLAAGGERLDLPAWANRKSIAGSMMAQGLRRASPVFRRLELVVRPRSGWVFSVLGRRGIGLFVVLLVVVLLLPVPFMNFLPAVAILCLLAGWLEQDGLVAAGGLCLGAVAIAVIPGLLMAAIGMV